MTHPDRKTSSLATASRWLAAFVLAWLPSKSAGASDSTPLTFRLESEHFDLLIQDHDPRPLIFRLERLHAALSRYFGATTRERMRIRAWLNGRTPSTTWMAYPTPTVRTRKAEASTFPSTERRWCMTGVLIAIFCTGFFCTRLFTSSSMKR